MIATARRNAELLGLRNVEFVSTQTEKLPVPDESVDAVISNGVFSLCPDKPSLLEDVKPKRAQIVKGVVCGRAE